MPKPCNDFLYPSDPHTTHREGCHLCTLAVTRADYAKLWGEPITPEMLRPRRTEISVLPPGKSVLPSCRFLGNPTGDSVLCPTCAGTVELKLFACTVFGQCTIKKRVGEHGCCEDCTSRE